MSKSKESITFKGRNDQVLSGVIEYPIDQSPYAFAIFAHCFTCGKNISTVRRITQSLTQSGIAVLRFDFTGIGDSDGSFEKTNFQSNLHDIISAYHFLSENYQAPELIVGHSLGGTAAIGAALELPEIKAIVSIAAPAKPAHVTNLMDHKLDEIKDEGKADIIIGQRTFKIEKQFIEDLKKHDFLPNLKRLKRPLLLLHSPQDKIVGIENAAEIYQHAHHPKSFITLDGADHMISDAKHAQYVGELIGTWVTKYIPRPEIKTLKTDHQVVASSQKENGFTTLVQVGKHKIIADEPSDVGGHDYGPSPYELLSSALATCTAMTVKMYADRKDWPLEECRVHINHEKKHAEDSISSNAKIDTFLRSVEFIGNLDKKQRERLLEIANKCPVHRTLESQIIRIETKLL
ncbi:MAG: bifunctional alpha/beta hydrolase/OsmC family protein [Salibacteraceae bacterium]